MPRGLIVSTGSTGYRSDTNVVVRLQGQYFNPFIIFVVMCANDLTVVKGMSVIKSFLCLTEHLLLKAIIGWRYQRDLHQRIGNGTNKKNLGIAKYGQLYLY